MSNNEKLIASQGDRIATYRKRNKLSQQQFADSIGVSRGYIGDIERGRSEPSSNFLTLLTSNFNISIDWVLTGEGSMLRHSSTPIDEMDSEGVALIFDGLNNDQKREVISVIREKKRVNELERLLRDLLNGES